MSDKGVVLVTGGSGFVAAWCIVSLLRQGYAVRTTVRDPRREPAVRYAIGKAADPGEQLRFFAADLLDDAGWDAAMAGCDYVLHVASPVVLAEPKEPGTLIRPAREGARRVISAAIRAGVKRVVLTSSVAAASKPGARDWISDEETWTDLSQPGVGTYTRSKTLAERAAWELIESEGEGKTTLTVINPTLVLGPVLSGDYSESVQAIERLLAGRVPGLPRIGFNIVDVRDVAELHVRAMTDEGAAGERFIAAGDYIWMGDMAALLRARLGDAAARVPTRKVPDLTLRLAGLFDKELRALGPRLGRKHDFSSAKARERLGWRPRPVEETIVDCAESLLREGLV